MKMMKFEIHLFMEVIARDVKFPTKLSCINWSYKTSNMDKNQR
jgi:hypothetical protein